MFLFLIFSSFCNMMSSEEFKWIANICRDMKYLRSLLEDIWYAGPLQNGWMGFADRFGQGLGKTFTLWRLWRFSIWKFIAMTFLGIFLLWSIFLFWCIFLTVTLIFGVFAPWDCATLSRNKFWVIVSYF